MKLCTQNLSLLLISLVSLGIWQYTRVFEVQKDIYEHHNEKCEHAVFPGYVMDLTRVKTVLFALVKDPDHSTTSLVSIHGIGDEVVTHTVAQLPAESYSFYLFQNETLWVLGPDSVNTYNLNETDTSTQTFAITHNDTVPLPDNLHYTISDIFTQSPDEFYLAQYTALAEPPSQSKSMQMFLEDFLGIQNSLMYQCRILPLPVGLTCEAVEDSNVVSYLGFTKDKFGSYFASVGSLNKNYLVVLERTSLGRLVVNYKVSVRDRVGKLEWDEANQRTYGASTGFWVDQWNTDDVWNGAVELKQQDYESTFAYRNLMNQKGRFHGGTCAARMKDKIVIGSEKTEGIYICPIAVPTN